MIASVAIVQRVVREEVYKLAVPLKQMDDVEGWYVFNGEHRTLGYVLQVDKVYEAAGRRLNLSPERVRAIKPPATSLWSGLAEVLYGSRPS